MKKQDKGITLIALVITIIILLILAGISITSLTGSGLFEKAKLAKNRTEEAQKLENQMLQEYENQIDKLGGDIQFDDSYNKIEFENIDESDSNPKGALPKGKITPIETNADNGIVIEDENNNQWVWVEVPRKTVFSEETTIDDYQGIERDLKNYVTYPNNYLDVDIKDEWHATDDEGYVIYEESPRLSEEKAELNNGCGLTLSEYKNLYRKMLSSVYKYGGFWVSRFEIGDADATEKNEVRNDNSGISGKPCSRFDQYPYTFITLSESQKLAERLVCRNNTKCSVLFGIQWNLVCKFLEVNANWDYGEEKQPYYYIMENATVWGNFGKYGETFPIINRGKILERGGVWKESNESFTIYNTIITTSTGAFDKCKKMNIYDFAGNVEEYLMGMLLNSSPCVAAGGIFNSKGSIKAIGRGK